MTGGAVLAAEVAQLETLDLEALRALWRQLLGCLAEEGELKSNTLHL